MEVQTIIDYCFAASLIGLAVVAGDLIGAGGACFGLAIFATGYLCGQEAIARGLAEAGKTTDFRWTAGKGSREK